MTVTRQPPPVRRSVSGWDRLRGLLSLLILVGLLAGAPIGLYLLGGSPLPDHWPTLAELMHLLTSRQWDDQLFIGLLLMVAWGAWAYFASAVLLETAARLRGRAASPVRGLGFAQRMAAHLLTSIGLALGSPLAAFATTPPVPAVVATAPPADTWSPHAGVTAVTPTDLPTHADDVGKQVRTHIVRSGECLWTVATKHLGRGDRYPEIFKLNQGRVMSDGVVFRDPDLIHPGWKLRLPITTRHVQPQQEPAQQGSAAELAPDMHEAHPGGDPLFSVPHPSATHTKQGNGDQTVPHVEQDEAAVPTPAPASPEATRAEHAPAVPTPSRKAVPEASATSSAASSPAPASRAEAEPAVITLASDSDRIDVPWEYIVPSAATGMIVGSLMTLTQLRRLQRNERRPGRRIRLPADPAAVRAEQDLRRRAAALNEHALPATLHALAPALRAADGPARVLGLELSPDALDVLLSQPAAPPEAFLAAGSTTQPVWRLPLPHPLVEQAPNSRLRTPVDVLPGLIAVGGTEDASVFLNLEELQVTTCHGPPELVDALLATVATEMAVTPCAGWFDLLAVGLPELPTISDRLTSCSTLEEAIDQLTRRARHLSGNDPALAPVDVPARRLADPDGEWELTALISRQAPTPDQLRRLLAATAGLTGGIAVLLPADPAATPTPGRLVLRAQSGEAVMEVHPLGRTVRPHALSLDSYAQLGQLFTVAADLGDVAADQPPYATHRTASAGADAPPCLDFAPETQQAEPESMPNPSPVPARSAPPAGAEPASQTSADEGELSDSDLLQVCILGPLQVHGAAAHLQPRMEKALVAIALAGVDGIPADKLCYIMGEDPDTPHDRELLRSAISRTRKKVGPAVDGESRILYNRSRDTYHVHHVRLDWHHFCDLAEHGERTRDTSLLWQALDLVRGLTLEGTCYWWLEPAVEEEIRAHIVDIAALTAELELKSGHAREAAKAARTGLANDPAAEQLWRALMSAYHLAGNLSGVEQAWKACLKVIEDISADGEPHRETRELYRQLTGRGRPPHLTYSRTADLPRLELDDTDDEEDGDVPQRRWA